MTKRPSNPDTRTFSSGELRRVAEGIASSKDLLNPERVENLSPDAVRRIVHELQVHQIELEMQNEELHRVSAETEALREKYFDLYDLAPAGYFTLDEHGVIRQSNLTAAGMLGAKRGEVVAQPFSRFIFAADQDVFYLFCRALGGAQRPQRCQLRIVGNDHRAFWVNIEGRSAQDEHGATTHRLIISDISEQKNSQLALIASHALNSAVLDAMPAEIVVVGADGRVVAVNRQWQRARSPNGGVTAEAVVGSDYLRTFARGGVPPVGRRQSFQSAKDVMDAGSAMFASNGIRSVLDGRASSFQMEYQCQPPQEKCWFEMTVTPFGELEMGVIVVHNNVSERKEVESARVFLELQLRESQKMEAMGTLAGGIAHDFNNIIAAIMGNAELAIQDAQTSPIALESLEEIRKAGRRAREIVRQILSYSRHQPSDRIRVALALEPLVDESVRLLRATLPSRVVLDVRCDPDVPHVLMDDTQIEQVLINLVTNSAQAIGDRPGRVSVKIDAFVLDAFSAEAHSAERMGVVFSPGPVARIRVTDDGPGIDAATMARAFDPFFTTKAVDEGTGLGLSIVESIVRGHEGSITIASVLGVGTTFTIYLPFATIDPVAAPTEHGSGAGTLTRRAANREHILYIDDDVSLTFLVSRILERGGYRVTVHSNPEVGVAAVRSNPGEFALVVTDYNMPGMSGLDVVREVRAIRADLPVAVASGYIDATLLAAAEGAGVKKLIFKADAVEDLCAEVARLLD